MREVQRIGFIVAGLAMAADQLFKNLLLYEFQFIIMRPFERVEVAFFIDNLLQGPVAPAPFFAGRDFSVVNRGAPKAPPQT